ncbi:MAG: hypothetical protein HY072_08735, partial [Deltaproteobacteria bacterium]|nr:hypothetical protein [Deltaproteobacteria bacterium]
MQNKRHFSDLSQVDWPNVYGDKLLRFFSLLTEPCIEVFYGIKAGTIPWSKCFSIGSIFGILILFHIDFLFLKKLHLQAIYPIKPYFYWSYCTLIGLSTFWMWGLFRTYQRRKLIERLTDIMLSAGLKSATGKLPGFVFDRPIDDFTRKLRLTRSNLPKEKFESAKSTLESSLQVFIDETRENRTSGTIDIIYSHFEMPQITYIDNIKAISPLCFVVGNTRAKQIKVQFRNVPHLMVAGQTGGGKSTFLRGFVTTLYLNNNDMEFTLIDLKGGLEFQLFEGLERIIVIPNVDKSIPALHELQMAIENRMAVLKENNCKDLDSYSVIPAEKRKIAPGVSIQGFLKRHLLVIDEAAEMF